MLVKIEALILIFPGTDFHFPSTSVPPGTFLGSARGLFLSNLYYVTATASHKGGRRHVVFEGSCTQLTHSLVGQLTKSGRITRFKEMAKYWIIILHHLDYPSA